VHGGFQLLTIGWRHSDWEATMFFCGERANESSDATGIESSVSAAGVSG
jgi:hypothetical protein